MTRKQDSAKRKITADDLKKLLAEDRDLLKTIVEETRQQVLEAEMDEALQASKGERTAGRLGYRAGYYNRMLVTRVGQIELRVPQDRVLSNGGLCALSRAHPVALKILSLMSQPGRIPARERTG